MKAPPPLLPDDEDEIDLPTPMTGSRNIILSIGFSRFPAKNPKPCHIEVLTSPDLLPALRFWAVGDTLGRYLTGLGYPTQIHWHSPASNTAWDALRAQGWPLPTLHTGPTKESCDLSLGSAPVPAQAERGLGLGATTSEDGLAIETQDPYVLRMALLRTPWNQELHLTADDLQQAHRELVYMHDALHRCNLALAALHSIPERGNAVKALRNPLKTLFPSLHQALSQALDTSQALDILLTFARSLHEANPYPGKARPDIAWSLAAGRSALIQAAAPLGLLQRFSENALAKLQQTLATHQDLNTDQIEQWVQQRSQARQDKDWDKADALMQRLQELGVEVMDSATGSTWRVKS